ncbi:MAG TPA: hypothetical protein ENJ45_02640 [Phaeodactylibacter sp.]|nr:hypothetical protein [Phaeodactylibacter sp.]
MKNTLLSISALFFILLLSLNCHLFQPVGIPADKPNSDPPDIENIGTADSTIGYTNGFPQSIAK